MRYREIFEGTLLSEGKPQVSKKEWGVTITPLLEPSLVLHRKKFHDLDEKLAKFIEVKRDNPLMAKYGKHDSPFTGPLIGFWHCHLHHDAILIYNLKNSALNIVCIVSHSEIEGRRKKSVIKQIAIYK